MLYVHIYLTFTLIYIINIWIHIYISKVYFYIFELLNSYIYIQYIYVTCSYSPYIAINTQPREKMSTFRLPKESLRSVQWWSERRFYWSKTNQLLHRSCSFSRFDMIRPYSPTGVHEPFPTEPTTTFESHLFDLTFHDGQISSTTFNPNQQPTLQGLCTRLISVGDRVHYPGEVKGTVEGFDEDGHVVASWAIGQNAKHNW